MPLLKIQTNLKLSQDKAQDFISDVSKTVATTLGKPERYVMVLLQHSNDMLFAGSNDTMAFCELKSIGFSDGQAAPASAAICSVLKDKLDIPSDRVYIEFANAIGKNWGWNGSTF